jgi:hypothetical protein
MEDVGALLTIAEIAVAFAGFSSIVVLFQNRTEGAWVPLDAVRFRLMLQSSLLAASFAVLPLPIHKLGVPSGVVWPLCGCILAVFLGLGGVAQFRARRLFSGASSMVRWASFQLLFWASFLAQLLNASGLVFHREPGPYIFGVCWLLFWAGYQFYQLMIPARPPAV